jgi:cyclopropane-fatty-acyl-phospholipid synthase
MEQLLHIFFARVIKTGSLEVETANGYKFSLGDGSGSKLALRFKDMGALFQLMLDPELQFGE